MKKNLLKLFKPTCKLHAGCSGRETETFTYSGRILPGGRSIVRTALPVITVSPQYLGAWVVAVYRRRIRHRKNVDPPASRLSSARWRQRQPMTITYDLHCMEEDLLLAMQSSYRRLSLYCPSHLCAPRIRQNCGPPSFRESADAPVCVR